MSDQGNGGAQTTAQPDVATPTPPSPSRPSRLRRALRWVTWGLVGVALLVVGAVGWLLSGWGRDWVRGQALTRAQGAVTGEVAWEGLDYGLGGGVRAWGLSVRGADGAQALTLGELEADLGVWALLRGDGVEVESLRVSGLRVWARQGAELRWNLQDLLKPRPAPPPDAKPPRPLHLRALTVRDLSAWFEAANGARGGVEGLALDGSLSRDPAQGLSVALARVGVGRLWFSHEAAGLGLSLDGVEGGPLSVTAQGADSAGSLGPWRGQGRLRFPGVAVEKVFDWSVGGAAWTRQGQGLRAYVADATAGWVRLARLEVEGALSADSGQLSGPLRVLLDGLHLNADALNRLFDRPLLATDVNARLQVEGPLAAVAVAGSLATAGGTLTAQGVLDLRDLNAPRYTLSLVGDQIDTAKLLHPDVRRLPLLEGSLRVDAKGQGVTRDTVEATVDATVGPTRVEGLPVEGVWLKATLSRGHVTIDSLRVGFLGQSLVIDGGFDPDTRQIKTRAQITGDAGAVARACAAQVLPCPEILQKSAGTISLDVQGAFTLPPDAASGAGATQGAGGGEGGGGSAHVVLRGESLETPETRLRALHLDMRGAALDWDAAKPYTRTTPGLLPQWVLARLPFQRGRLDGHATLDGFEVPAAKLSVERAHAVIDLDLTGPQPLGEVEVSGHGLKLGDAWTVEAFGVRATLTQDRLSLSLSAEDAAKGLKLDARAFAQPSDFGGIDLTIESFSLVAPPLGPISLGAPLRLWLPEDVLTSPRQILLPMLPLNILGGQLRLKGTIDTAPHKTPDGRTALTVQGVSLSADLEGLPLESLRALGVKLPPGLGGRLGASLTARGPLGALDVQAQARATLTHPKLPKALSVSVDIASDLSSAQPSAQLEARATMGRGVALTLRADAPLSRAGGRWALDADRPLSASLSAPDLDLSALALPLPPALRPLLASARLDLDLRASGAATSPKASARARLHGASLPLGLDLSASLTPRGGGGASLRADLRALWPDGTEALTAHATADGVRLPTAQRPWRRPKRWEATLNLPHTPLHRLTSLTSWAPKLTDALKPITGGAVSASLSAQADGSRHRASLSLSVHDLTLAASPSGAPPPTPKPINATLRATLHDPSAPAGVSLSLTADAAPARLSAQGHVALPADALPSASTLRAAPLTLTLDAPALPLSAWAESFPALRALSGWPGDLRALAAAGGTLSAPTLDAAITYAGWTLRARANPTDPTDPTAPPTTPGVAVARVTLDDHDLRAALTLGPAHTSSHTPAQGLRLEVATPAATLHTLRPGAVVPLTAHLTAPPQPLAHLLPAHLTPPDLGLHATFTADLHAAASVLLGAPSPLDALDLRGIVRLSDGAFTLPNSGRTWRDLTLDLRADGQTLHLDALRAHEAAEGPDLPPRALSVRGQAALDRGRLTRAALHLTTDRWLAIGKPYAPTASITLDADLDLDLTQTPRAVALRVNALDLQNPNRFKFTHYQDFLDRGDVTFLQPDEAPGSLRAVPTPAPIASLLKQDTPWRVTLTLPPDAHAYFSPLDLHVTGGLTADVGPQGLKVSGQIDVTAGEMEFTGTRYVLARGRVHFNDGGDGSGCDRGCLDLHFQRPPDPAALRDLSLESGGGQMGLSLVGPIGTQALILRGAGNADLTEVSAIQTARRPRYLSHPDMPAAQAVQHPGPETPLIHTFIRTNMPHLILVDRASAWADPLDDLDAYGKLQHAEVDDYAADGSRRLHIRARPPTPGRDRAEVAYEWLLRNDARWLIAAGPRLGTSAQAGARLLLRWSSDR